MTAICGRSPAAAFAVSARAWTVTSPGPGRALLTGDLAGCPQRVEGVTAPSARAAVEHDGYHGMFVGVWVLAATGMRRSGLRRELPDLEQATLKEPRFQAAEQFNGHRIQAR